MRRLRTVVVFAVLISVSAVGCSSDESNDSREFTTTTITAMAETTTTTTLVTTSGGAVAADDASVEITYTDDGTSYTGDRVITDGTVTVIVSNESDGVVIAALFWYESGSEALAEEMSFLNEGEKGIPVGLPADGYTEIELDGSGELSPGTHTWTVDLQPGTYIFDVGPMEYHTTGLWRAAVFDVVSQ